MNAVHPLPEPIRLTPELRKKLETAVDQILTLLDATAPDPDLEPSLGAPENHLPLWSLPEANRGRVADQRQWAGGAGALDEEPETDEPSLGATHDKNQHRAWYRYEAGDDREQEHDGGEPDADREPWLGWCASGALGSNDDRELDP